MWQKVKINIVWTIVKYNFGFFLHLTKPQGRRKVSKFEGPQYAPLKHSRFISICQSLFFDKLIHICTIKQTNKKQTSAKYNQEILNVTGWRADWTNKQFIGQTGSDYIIDWLGLGSFFLDCNTAKKHFSKVWVAKVRAHTHTCDVRSHVCVCVWNPFWKVCEMCVRVARFWACDVRSHFCTLFGTKRARNGIYLS